MFIKETVITERSGSGRVTRRITTVETHETYTDHDYDWDTMRGRGYVADSSFDRIMEAYVDYRMSRMFD